MWNSFVLLLNIGIEEFQALSNNYLSLDLTMAPMVWGGQVCWIYLLGKRNIFLLGEKDITWLMLWNKKLGSALHYKFMPNATEMAMKSLSSFE